MNRKQFGILIVLLIALGGAAWLVTKSRNRNASSGEAGTGQKLMGDAFPLNDVARISMTQGTNELHLEKKNDVWKVWERSDYPANFPQISEFLITVRDLKVIQNESVGPSQLPRLQLTATGAGTNLGIVVDLKDQTGKSIRSFTLGKKHMAKAKQRSQFQFGDEGTADGRYVLLGDDARHALLIGNGLTEAEPKPDAWLDKEFFKVERPKAIAVSYASGSNSWKINKDTESGDWKLAGAKPDEKLDDARVSGVSSPFASPSFNDVFATGKEPAGSGLDKPNIITIDTFDDFTYTIKVGAKLGDNYPLTVTVASNFQKERIPAKDEKAEDKDKADKAWKVRQGELETKLKSAQRFSGWVYMVPIYVVDPITKDRKELLVEKKEEQKTDVTKPDAPNK